MPEPLDAPIEAGERATDTLPHLVAVFARAEFKAPIEALTGLVSLLAEDYGLGLPERFKPDVDKVSAAAARLGTMVNLLLEPADASRHDDDPETFASVLRHDLRTPLTAILGYGELLSEEAEGTDLETGLLADIIGVARRLLGQIDGMVDFIKSNGAESEGRKKTQFHAPPDMAGSLKSIGSVLLGSVSPVRRATGRILVVDDNESTLDLLSRLLSRDGHQVTTQTSGVGALQALATPEAFDLILLDLLMPGMSGIEVLAKLKEDAKMAVLPVIMISAFDEIEGTARCIEAGADDYLTKPVDAVLLRARVGATLDRKLLRDREQAITHELMNEQARSESLLRNVLPASVVERLRAGEAVIADHFAEATILFSDLVGFTALTAALAPERVLDMLNRIFSGFDRLAADHGLEKIKTIGDAYMVAGGLPEPRPDHAAAVAAMGLRMPGIVREVSGDLGLSLGIRIGMHSGPVAAGIIGTDKFIYDVWGDTVNVASRMEHHGEAGRVHCSAETLAALGPGHPAEARAPIEVKGRGRMETFFLLESRA